LGVTLPLTDPPKVTWVAEGLSSVTEPANKTVPSPNGVTDMPITGAVGQSRPSNRSTTSGALRRASLRARAPEHSWNTVRSSTDGCV
jgi:hypothetical protein